MKQRLLEYIQSNGLVVYRNENTDGERIEFDECYYYPSGYSSIRGNYIVKSVDIKSLRKQIMLLAIKLCYLNPDLDSSIIAGYIELLLDVKEMSGDIAALVEKAYSVDSIDVDRLFSVKKIQWKENWIHASKEKKMEVVWRVLSNVYSSDVRIKVESAIDSMIEMDLFVSQTTLNSFICSGGDRVGISSIRKYINENEKKIVIHNMKLFDCHDGREYRKIASIDIIAGKMKEMIDSGERVTKAKLAEVSNVTRQTVINNWDLILKQYNENA